MRVLYVITDLATGGAEKQLARIIARLGKRIEPLVISLGPRGSVSTEIEEMGVPVRHLGLVGPVQLPLAMSRVFSIVRRFRPDVVQGWMYHGNLAALFAKHGLGRRLPLVWGVRQSLHDLAREKKRTLRVIRMSARWSSLADAIVYNAYLSRAQHEAIGFAPEIGLVIGNGFDGRVWRPDEQARRSVRKELGIAPDTPLIGMIARYHPIKGHEVFMKAAAHMAESNQQVHFICVGREITQFHPTFRVYTQMRPLRGRLHLLGERRDVQRLTAALDIATSSSWSEAFSNSVAEALCCGVPVVATDVGDTHEIVRDAGIIVPVGDVEAMANSWHHLLDVGIESRRAMGKKGRKRILKRYSIESVACLYLNLYQGLK